MGKLIRLKCGVNAEVVPLDGRPGGHLRLSLHAYPCIHPQHFPITREEAVALARQLLDAAGVLRRESGSLPPPVRVPEWESAWGSREVVAGPLKVLDASEQAPAPPPADPPAPTWRDRPPLL